MQLKLDANAKKLVKQILCDLEVELTEDEDEQDDKLLLSLVASTPNCLTQYSTEITKIAFDKEAVFDPILYDQNEIVGLDFDFEVFHDGCSMGAWSYKELLEYTKQSEKELRDLAQKLIIRADLMRQVVTLIEA